MSLAPTLARPRLAPGWLSDPGLRTHARVVGIGIDTADVDAIGSGLRTFGSAYLRRVCAPGEAATLPQDDDLRTLRLAELWAAKEAATKTLAPAMHDPWPWPAIAIDLDGGTVTLAGRPAGRADECGVHRITVCRLPDPALPRPPSRYADASPPVARTVTVVALAWTSDARGTHSQPTTPETISEDTP